MTVVSETTGSDGKIWYKIQFSSGSGTQGGYVRSDYIKFPVSYSYDANFESYLNSQGFPESYKTSLRTLHTEHPTWVFQAQKTGLNWSDVMEAEGAVGTNLVSKASISSWKSTDYGAYDGIQAPGPDSTVLPGWRHPRTLSPTIWIREIS